MGAQKPCGKNESGGEVAPAARRVRSLPHLVDLWSPQTARSKIAIQQLTQSVARLRENWHAVREEHLFSFVGQKLSQRPPHFFFIRAVLPRKKSETVRLEIDQCVAHDKRSVA